jgi:hypothetical protein
VNIVVIPMHKPEPGAAKLVGGFFKNGADRVVIANDGWHHGNGEAMEAQLEHLVKVLGDRVLWVDVPASRRGLPEVYGEGIKDAVTFAEEYDIIIEADAGGSHLPEDLPRFIEVMHTGVGLACGCRFDYGFRMAGHFGSWQRRELSRAGTMLTNAVFGTHFHDATSGFVVYTPLAAKHLFATPFKSTGHYYQTELRLRALGMGIKLAEVPIRYHGGQGSTLNFKSIGESLYLTARLRLGV